MFRYYKEDKDVKEDTELQACANELSLDGTGLTGGIGRVNMKIYNNNNNNNNNNQFI